MVLGVKIFPAVVVRTDSAKKMHHFHIAPGKVNLVRQKAATGALWVQVVVVVPFAGHIAGP